MSGFTRPASRQRCIRWIAYVAVAMTWTLGLASDLQAQTSVSRIDLGVDIFTSVYAINNVGEIVGSTFNSGSPNRAFSWTPSHGLMSLGFGSPRAVNDSGQVVGYWLSIGPRPALWRPDGTLVKLGTLGGNTGIANAINEAGQVAGSSQTPESPPPLISPDHAFFWTTAAGMVDLGTLGGDVSSAVALNDAGQVVGASQTALGGTHAFVWTTEHGMVDLGTLGGTDSSASAINKAGYIVGSSRTIAGTFHAFVWTPTSGMVDLGTLGGAESTAVAINQTGQVVGWSQTAAGSPHAFLWSPEDGMVDLGTLGDVGDSTATDVNDAGQVVGYSGTPTHHHAFFWTVASGMIDLGTLGGDVSRAVAINNIGQVAGDSTLFPGSSPTHAIRWEVSFGADTTPPSIHGVTASESVLAPPNHRIVPITLSVDATDAVTSQPSCAITEVHSNQPGDDDQWTITAALKVDLVASRDAALGDRVYTITVRCTDSAGNISAPAGVTVIVPRDHATKTPNNQR